MTQPAFDRVVLGPADPSEPDARQLIAELGAELERITGWFAAASYTPDDARVPRSAFVIARDPVTGRALGCGAIRPLDESPETHAELKRMYARPGTKGVGHAVLAYLENAARSFGYTTVWLETGVQNHRAVRFYERHGYRRIENFGEFIGRPESTCLGRSVADPVSD
jgi:GNAT superfamily N-acetyltransferase